MYNYPSYYMDAEFDAPKCMTYRVSKVAFCHPKLKGKQLGVAYILAVYRKDVMCYLKRHIDKQEEEGMPTYICRRVPVYKASKDKVGYLKGSTPAINLTGVTNRIRKVILEAT